MPINSYKLTKEYRFKGPLNVAVLREITRELEGKREFDNSDVVIVGVGTEVVVTITDRSDKPRVKYSIAEQNIYGKTSWKEIGHGQKL